MSFSGKARSDRDPSIGPIAVPCPNLEHPDTALEAIRLDAYEGLAELGELLGEGGTPNFGRIANAVTHLWYHVGLTKDDEFSENLVTRLRDLSVALSSSEVFDRAWWATEIRSLAEAVWARWCA